MNRSNEHDGSHVISYSTWPVRPGTLDTVGTHSLSPKLCNYAGTRMRVYITYRQINPRHGVAASWGIFKCIANTFAHMLEHIENSTSCVGINLGCCATLGVSPRLIPRRAVTRK